MIKLREVQYVKRVSSVLLCLCIALSLLPTTALADEIGWSSAMTYDSGTETYTVFSADNLRWIFGASNGTITAETYQTDPDVPANANFDGAGYRVTGGYAGSGSVNAGGIAGKIDGSSLYNSEANVDINFTDECGTVYAGGLVGLNSSGSICNCAATGAVTLHQTHGHGKRNQLYADRRFQRGHHHQLLFQHRWNII